MRVAHVLRSDHAGHVGGDLTQLHASVEALRMVGVESAAIEARDLDSREDVVHLYNLQLPLELAASFRVVRRRCPQALIALSPIYWPLDRAAVRRERGVSRYYAPLHMLGPRRRMEWLVCRYVLARADLILPNSNIEIDRVTRHFRVRRSDQWQSVPNGIWVDRWTTDVLEPRLLGPLRVACVARLEPQKNQLRLIEAVAAIPGARLELIGPAGEPAYAERVRAHLATMLGDRGQWHGALHPREVLEILKCTHVHALPSFRETPGLASIEAAAAGCAIVATREGSAEEYFGSLAFYADPRSVESITAAISAAELRPNQPELRHLVQRYDWSVVGEVLRDSYATSLARSRRRS